MEIDQYKTSSDILTQYDAVAQTYEHVLGKASEIRSFFVEHSLKKMIFLACGSGFCVSQSAAHSANLRGIPATALPAGDLLLNFKSYEELLKDSVIVAPSRSGSSSELIKVLEQTGKMGIPCLALSGTEDSPLSKLADLTLTTPWVLEKAVCQTKTVVSLYVFNLMSVAIASDKTEELFRELKTGIDFAQKTAGQWHKKLVPIISSGEIQNIFNLADSEAWGIADEGTMAIKEMSLVESYTYHLLDVRHGPIVMITDKSLVFILLSSAEKDIQSAFVKDIKAKGARIVTCGPGNLNTGIADLHLELPHFDNQAVYGLQFILPSQLTAVYRSAMRGLNPDAPTNLTPWIRL